MNLDFLPRYFLGANSAEGFINEFKNSYDVHDGWLAYIIKGGPGTGKSSLMKKIAKKAAGMGEKCILCPCSSDPFSLDAVILPDCKKIILDGTAPHVVEPKYPAVCEQIINTGDFWNEKGLDGKREKLLDLFALNGAYHKKAAQYITAAGQIAKYGFAAQLSAADIEKTVKFACAAAKANLPPTDKKGREWVRFLSGITPDGLVFYGDTITKESDRQIIISDKYGAVSSVFMSVIRDIALKNGYEIITVKNALLPGDITDHIIIPELSLAFCTENDFMSIDSPARRIHSRRFTDMAKLNRNRQKLNFNKRIAKELLGAAISSLQTAKALHDQMEKYFIDIMDFDSLNEYCEKTVDKFFK